MTDTHDEWAVAYRDGRVLANHGHRDRDSAEQELEWRTEMWEQLHRSSNVHTGFYDRNFPLHIVRRQVTDWEPDASWPVADDSNIGPQTCTGI